LPEQNKPSLAVTMLLPRLLNAADVDTGATIPSTVTPQRLAGYMPTTVQPAAYSLMSDGARVKSNGQVIMQPSDRTNPTN